MTHTKIKQTRDLSEWLKLKLGTKEDQVKTEFPDYWRAVVARQKLIERRERETANWMEIENEM